MKLAWNILPWAIIFFLIAVIFITVKDFSLFGKKQAEITITHNNVLQKIESLGKMELVKYNFRDVVEFEKKDYNWLPASSVVLIVGGEAVGCIDLGRIKKEDVFESGDTITIMLPEPELCYFKINHENSKVYDLKYTYFQDKHLIDAAYREAEKQLKQSALQMNIIGQTKKNANIILKPVFEKITGKTVVFTYEILKPDNKKLNIKSLP